MNAIDPGSLSLKRDRRMVMFNEAIGDRIAIIRQQAYDDGKSEKEIRAALRAAYPFGERKYHPYKIWLDEIRVQRGMKPSKYASAEEHYAGRVAEIRAHNKAVGDG